MEQWKPKPTDQIILSNQMHCSNCNVSVYSAHQHDYQHCPCGRVMVDGGMAYLRRNTQGEEESIIVRRHILEKLQGAIEDPTKNTLGHVCNLVRVLRDDLGCNLSQYYDKKESKDG
jgi:hypothetical protein